ncbi:MAG TPA: serine hydrolase domain-containing protein [Chitinophagaceae bacterium]|nr:serine hydrolase domain-containing protein [Chitinophagaceae bacterium]
MKLYQVPLFLTVLVTCSFACSAQSSLSGRIDSLFRSYSDSGLAGSLLVVENDQVTLRKGYGYSNNTSKAANTPATLFNVASIGKQFTMYAILQLEAAGKLKTSDHLYKFIGRFGDMRDSITILHLLHHRSGMVKQGTDLNTQSRDGFIQSVKQAQAESVPGEKYRYTNAGYSMLAAVVEIASGLPFETYVRKHIFIPLGMHNTGYPWEKHIPKNQLATGYNSNREALPAESDQWASRGPGNMVTTMDDLYIWIKAYDNKAFMPSPIRERILRDALPGQETFSWNKARTSRGTPFYHKGGGRIDFESRMMWWPEDKVLVVFSLNNDYNLARKLFTAIREMMH